MASSTEAEPPTVIPAEDTKDEPEERLVDTLRQQINDLLHQVNQINSKLVQSYDRVSDLEDTLHVTSENLHSSTLQISQLEIERAQHLSALNTGLLVEKSTITTELTRLMERVSEETAQRGEAETAKLEIEKDLDDLSASLFNQANTMVAEARYARAMSERKAEDAQTALRGAEEAVSIMQAQMQNLTEMKETAERDAEDSRHSLGGVVGKPALPVQILSPKLSTAHIPYQEFLLFNSHIRSIKSSREPKPTIVTLIAQPFAARLQVEDSDPTLRLDFAPSLNWLTRRSVQSAVQAGQLTIEPVQSSRLTQDPTLASTILGPPSLQDLTCALCGKHVFPSPPNDTRGRRLPLQQTANSWASTSRFLKAQLTSTTSNPPSPTNSLPSPTYVFRVALAPAPNQKPSTTYPLCHSGFCVKRLRATCELWHFVRKDIIAHVWSEPEPETAPFPPPPRRRTSSYFSTSAETSPVTNGTVATSPPVLPPRRSVVGRVGNLWEKGLGAFGGPSSASSSRAASPARGLADEPPRRVPPPPVAPSLAPTADAHIPPIPPRRRPNAPAVPVAIVKEEIPAITHDNAEATVSGLLTPASESEDEFKDAHDDVVTDNNASSSNDHSSTSAQAARLSSSSDNIFEVPSLESEDTTAEEEKKNVNGLSAPAEISENPTTPKAKAATELPENDADPKPEANVTASPGPPPLPRRAAARGPIASPVPSRTSSPVPLNLAIAQDVATTPVAEPTAKESSAEPIPAFLADNLMAVDSSDPKLGEKSEVSLEIPENPEVAPPASPGSHYSELSHALSHGAAEEPIMRLNTLPENTTPLEEQLAAASTLPPPALPPRLASPSSLLPTNGTSSTTIPVAHESASSESVMNTSLMDGSSWEEQSWKELVRLREDMFWARMGAMRDSEQGSRDGDGLTTPI